MHYTYNNILKKAQTAKHKFFIYYYSTLNELMLLEMVFELIPEFTIGVSKL